MWIGYMPKEKTGNVNLELAILIMNPENLLSDQTMDDDMGVTSSRHVDEKSAQNLSPKIRRRDITCKTSYSWAKILNQILKKLHIDMG